MCANVRCFDKSNLSQRYFGDYWGTCFSCFVFHILTKGRFQIINDDRFRIQNILELVLQVLSYNDSIK